MTYTELLKNVWNALYDPQSEVIETVEKFFHPSYKQCINCVLLDRDGYIAHALEQKKNIIIDTIDYKHVMEKENELFAIYYPRGINLNKLPIEAEVIAYFRFENQQIFRIHGLVRLIKGDLAEVDMQA